MKFIRTKHGDLQTGSLYYCHVKTRRRFVLIGVCHIADAAYWKKLTGDLAILELSGFTVHLEGVSWGDRPIPPVEGRTYEVVAKMLGENIQSQYVGLTKGPRWQHTDMDVEQMLQVAEDPDALRTFIESLDKPIEGIEDLPQFARRFLHWVLRNRWVVEPVANVVGRKSFPKWIREILINVRTRYAMGLMLHASTDDIVTVWGAGHLALMHDILLDAGFTTYGEPVKWSTALAKPKR